MTNPSAAAMSLRSWTTVPRQRVGTVTRRRPIRADANQADAAGAVGADARSAFHFNLPVLLTSWRRNRSACLPPARPTTS
jgi:hypothetical protein